MRSPLLQSLAVGALRGVGRVGARAAASAVGSVLKDVVAVAAEVRQRADNALETLEKIIVPPDHED